VNSKIYAVLELAKDRVIGLDTEWKVTFGRQNQVIGQHPIGCIQLGYVDRSDTVEKALLIYTGTVKRKTDGTKPNLPQALSNLLGDSSITLAAVNLSGNISKLKKDFNLDSTFARRDGEGLVDLGDYAVRRSVADRSVGLQSLLGILFKKRILKDRSALFSDWNTRNPTQEQNQYGAEDAISHVRCYFAMEEKPDLSRRLNPSDAKPGTVVDIVPRNGNIACMASRGATGIIEQATEA